MSRLISIALLWITTLQATPPAATESRPIRLAVYPSARGTAPARVDISVAGSSAEPASVIPVDPTRPLLLIVDPASYPKPELGTQLTRWGAALSHNRVLAPSSIRLGVAVLDGVLSEPIKASAAAAALEQVVSSYVAESSPEVVSHPGRLMDVIVNLMDKAAGDGSIDCVVIARDRELPGGNAYVSAAIRRRLSVRLSTSGSTLYGHIAGAGELSRSIVDLGGETFGSEQAPDAILSTLALARASGVVVSLARPTGARFQGWLPITVGTTQSGMRAPRAFWWVADDSPAPDYASVSRAVELLERAGTPPPAEQRPEALRPTDSWIQEAISLDPWNPAVILIAGRAALSINDVRRAEEAAARLLTILPIDPAAVASYCDLAASTGGWRQARESMNLLQKHGYVEDSLATRTVAGLLSAAGEYDEAAKLYESLPDIALNGNQEVQAEYAWVLMKQGKAADAAKHFAAAAGSRNPKVLLGQSELAMGTGNLEQAFQLASRAIREHAGNPDALIQMARVQLRRSEWDGAIISLDGASAAGASRPEMVLLRAEAEIGAGRMAEAEKLLLGAANSEPAEPRFYSQLAELQLKIGTIEGAARTLESGASTGSDPADLLVRAAELRERRGEFGQALLDYRGALSAEPRLREDLSAHIEFLSSMIGAAAEAQAAENKPPQPSASDAKRLPGLVIPGGRQLLARSLGVDPAALGRPDAAERMFGHILEQTSSDGTLRDNPLAVSVHAYLRDYDALIKHLNKLGLIKPGQDLTKPIELVFPLAGPYVKVAHTADFLSFFGIRYKAPKPGDTKVELTTSQSRTAESRLRLLNNLGGDLLNRQMKEIRISFCNESIPMLLGSEAWLTQILATSSAGANELLRTMVQSADAMRLYVALARCSQALPPSLLESGLAGGLLPSNRALFIYGTSLAFEDGTIVLPGSREAWESLLGAPVSNRKAFLTALLNRDQGRAMLLYQALSSASESVRQYLTSSPARLTELYQLMASYDATRLASGMGDSGRQELGRILRIASADDKGIYFSVDAKIPHLISGTQEAVAGRLVQTTQPAANGHVDLPTLASLLTRGSVVTPTLFTTPVDTLEMVEYLKSSRPDLLSERTVTPLLRHATQAPLYLDLIWYVGADADLMARYLAYCRSLAAAGDKGRSAARTRSSQAFFYLLSALCRENILPRTDGSRILSDAIARLETQDESVFARNLASILSRDLMPVLTASAKDYAGDPVLRALAGRGGKKDVPFEGKRFEFDAAGFRASRMQTAIAQQSAAPLAKVLGAYTLLAGLDSSEPDGPARQLLKVLDEIGSLQRAPKPVNDATRGVPRANIEDLSRRVERLIAKQEAPASVRDRVAAGLNVELGVSLLAYAYADNASQDAAILAFDPHFVRKHNFYPDAIQDGYWRRAYVSQDEQAASIMTGSIVGLRDELSRLETLQSGQSFGTQGAGLVPVLLSDMRGIPHALRTDRAQEYVALSVRLGLEVAFTAARDAALAAWLTRQANTMLGAHRRELLKGWVTNAQKGPAPVFSRSELFILGRNYILGADQLPAFRSPTADKLRGMMPPPGSADAAQFELEIAQYGPRQTSRSGMDQRTFQFADSYESLEANIRSNVLFDRICDLKIRIAELNYAAGLPASLAGCEGELALKEIVPENQQLSPNSWRTAVERIARLDMSSVRRWMEELGLRGCLNEKLGEQIEATTEVRK